MTNSLTECERDSVEESIRRARRAVFTEAIARGCDGENGLRWDTSQLSTTGVISVTTVPVPAASLC